MVAADGNQAADMSADTSAYDFFPAVDGDAPQTCQGGVGHNSWYGSGEVDALKAVGG